MDQVKIALWVIQISIPLVSIFASVNILMYVSDKMKIPTFGFIDIHKYYQLYFAITVLVLVTYFTTVINLFFSPGSLSIWFHVGWVFTYIHIFFSLYLFMKFAKAR